ncbi:SHOCT domain-containing protein [Natronorubrum thiooxidans]|uniref:Short C-terminal domain-containing protein n=1 Tax=Natronorubrum thiooxidans TaxID=308853 RepID=A0A1N7EHI2_9EURY|nr:SHOCT domain-containing protein [Natronorubrum thiooxidans]SIR87504.1 Short C-terminal domain-containing protein [Natronorubrum thiooxidans]
MGSESGGRNYSLTEIFAIKFVLADILIIAVLLLAGPLYALAITALLVGSVFLVWYLTQRVDRVDPDDETAVSSRTASERDPVTKLQKRYAAGELSDAEFEAKLERLIDADERADAAGVDTAELELERSE